MVLPWRPVLPEQAPLPTWSPIPVCIHLLGRNVGTLAAGGVGKGGVQEDLPVPLEQRLSLQVKSFPLTLGKACKLWGQQTGNMKHSLYFQTGGHTPCPPSLVAFL